MRLVSGSNGDASRGFRAVRTIAAATVLGSDTPGGGLTARRT